MRLSPCSSLPKTPEGRASRILQGLLEEALKVRASPVTFGLPFLGSRLFQELLEGREGRKAEALVARRLRADPVLAQALLPLPLPEAWREAAREGAKGDGRIPLFPELQAA